MKPQVYEFANDVYDVLAGNTNYITQEQFVNKYGGWIEHGDTSSTIYMENFVITISKD